MFAANEDNPGARDPKTGIKPRRFRLHFNRINMQRGLPGIWSVHVAGRCFQVPEVIVGVSVTTVFRPDGPQPRAFLTGRGVVEQKDGLVIIS